jgi:prepilin-type N-terminal cleavage/methylation domain-containing protein
MNKRRKSAGKLKNNLRTNDRRRERDGFTLVEVIVVMAIFTLVTLAAVGALLSIVAANRETQAMKSVMNNLNFALESMSRNIRTGSNYRCPNDDCDDGGATAATHTILFTDSAGQDTVYTLDGGIIKRGRGGVYTGITTSTTLVINRLDFYIYGNGVAGDHSYPRVLILVGGTANVAGRQSSFDIETMVTQRMPPS